MKTKEMTKQEIHVYLSGTKILCTSTEETAKVQEKLFELGVEWMSQGKEVCEDKYLLFINEKQQIQHCSEINYWIKDVSRCIEPTEILVIQIKEEKPKFSPMTLHVFDKILVRNSNNERWRARFFDSYEVGFITTNGSVFEFGVPFNEETKHLHGTTEEAPEFYRI